MSTRVVGEYYRFRTVPVGGYFFYMLSLVPCLKVDGEHCVEGGSSTHRKVDPEERVVPLEFARDPGGSVCGVKIGIYTVPLPAEG